MRVIACRTSPLQSVQFLREYLYKTLDCKIEGYLMNLFLEVQMLSLLSNINSGKIQAFS